MIIFPNTRAAFAQILDEIKKFVLIFTVASQIFYIAYLIYALVAGIGINYVNVALLIFAAFYLGMYVCLQSTTDKRLKRFQKNTRHVLNWSKIAAKSVDIAMIIYAIVISSESFTPVSAVFSVIALMAWVIQVILELVIMYVESRWELISQAFRKDVEPIAHPLKAVKNAADGVVQAVANNVSAVGAAANAGAQFAAATGHPVVAAAVAAAGEGIKELAKIAKNKENKEKKEKKEKNKDNKKSFSLFGKKNKQKNNSDPTPPAAAESSEEEKEHATR